MKALVVYDSFFGNTQLIGEAIGKALGSETTTISVKNVTTEHLKELDILVVGSPTRAFSATKPINAFIHSIPGKSLQGVNIAGFDTRMSIKDVNNKFLTFMVGIFGFAAEPIAAKLKKKGGTESVPPGGFIVTGEKGPLKEGELDRAASWASTLLTSTAI